MKFSETWLREWVNPEITSEQLAESLTMAGLEVDAVEKLGEGLDGIKVGQIVKAEPHPDADKLQLCMVDVGADEQLQIICGAPNARNGLKVAVATIGSVLPGDFKIRKAKLRGVESFGMLCSEKELRLSEASDGILELNDDAPIGKSLVEYLQLKDTVIEVDLTPNRGDCLGLRGIAREVGVLTRTAVQPFEITEVPASIDDKLPISLSAPESCPRYIGRVLRGIDPAAATPVWMQQRLERSGIRAIDPVVDVTNYVLLELGHPMHAFDLDEIAGGINVRHSGSGETLTLLDGQEVKLTADTLLIADQEKALAIAGVMGGEHSGINSGTRDIFLESAWFNPVAIAGKAREYGLHTDASHRYERGVDYRLQAQAMERATALLLDIVGGKAGPLIEAVKPEYLPAPVTLHLRRARIERLVGMAFEDEQVTDILSRLGLELSAVEDGWRVQVPSFRFDIDNEESLVEELVRVYGYNRLPSRKPRGEMAMFKRPESQVDTRRISDSLVARGFQEVITYSFIDPGLHGQLTENDSRLRLLNPISSEMSEMRSSLLPGLVQAARYNLNRQAERIRIFETGLKFAREEGDISQVPMVAGLIAGNYNENWADSQRAYDFFDAKGDVEALLGLGRQVENFSFVPAKVGFLHPGQTASVLREGRSIGLLGKLHPALVTELDLPEDVFVFELELEPLLDRPLPAYEPLSRFPSIRRDLALLVDDSVRASELLQSIREEGGKLLTDVNVFDVYTGEKLEKGKKSIALALTLRHREHTLTESEVNTVMERITAQLQNRFAATLRS